MKDMNYNFDLLEDRVLDCLAVTDLNYIKDKIKEIGGPTLCIGSGGSKIVSDFASKILNFKNNCATKTFEPRDTLYENLNAYQNIFISSYSGTNYGVEVACLSNLKKYLLTTGKSKNNDLNLLRYSSSYETEDSFISLGATLMPMGILLSYYLDCDITKLIKEMFTNASKINFTAVNELNKRYDIMSGNDTSTPALFLDSTFTEAALGTTLIHSKYDFCHGRSTLPYYETGNLIYISSNKKELDYLLLNLLKNKYYQIINLDSNFNDIIIDNYYLVLQAMYLSKFIVTQNNIDLSNIKYDKEIAHKLYLYKGVM